jgi:hypothetical protein
VLIHSGLDTATRTDIIDKFDKRTQVEEGEARPRVLVSTTDIAGKGFTCVRAKHVWLMEPAFRERDEKQAYSRVRRYGQKAKVVYSWRACCPDIEIENSIMKRQQLLAWVEKQTMEARVTMNAEKKNQYDLDDYA